ncbi:uncharacterized protein LOC109135485 [Beta vulgaris subsp. vulgaris]|uniref:uncharacterized protein LOC109135485 n=1 Tax=Beta vulgaris subsp. vulgaris TaxID=3555 RepID=UPI0009015330|nr:uncharacterized protein LOC109135485 [Beta vulgaris subsp. vulgaris]
MPSSLRRLFATILVYCQPTGLRTLWDEFFTFMVEDYPSLSTTTNNNVLTHKLLQDLLDRLLQPLGKTISDFTALPSLPERTEDTNDLPNFMKEYFSVPIPEEDMTCVNTLNRDQRHAFDTIMDVVISKNGGAFFVDGPGATLLHQVRTSHSTFQLPLQLDSNSTCSFTKRSKTATILKHSAIIIWDEAPMTHKYQFEAVDRSLRDLMGNDLPFGGRTIVG